MSASGSVLLLIDNVFRFIQAGGVKCPGFLGRLPSGSATRPTMATEVAEFEERITSVAGACGDVDPGGLCSCRRFD